MSAPSISMASDGTLIIRCDNQFVDLHLSVDPDNQVSIRHLERKNYKWVPGGVCRHLRDQIRLQECKTCGGTVRIKVFGCEVFDECALGKPPTREMASCSGCQKFEVAENGHKHMAR
jgi:hypothetical protein